MANHANNNQEFDSMDNYAIGAVQGYLEMQGLTDISNLDVAVEMDEAAGTDSFNITAGSYTYDGVPVTGLDIAWSFDSTGQLTSTAGTGIDTLGVAAINEESIEMWYEYSNPDSGDEYAKIAVEELFKQVGIENYNNLVASASVDKDGKDNITINLDQYVSLGTEEIYIFEIALTFSSEGSIESKTGIPAELTNTFSDGTLDIWYEYSGPDKQRQSDQQDGGYFEGDASHTQIHSNVYTWEDGDGTMWTVVDKDVGGVWTSTETGSNGDVRTKSNSYNQQTNTNTFTETYVSTGRGIDSKMVQEEAPSGITRVYTGKADGIGGMPLHDIYSSLDVTETLNQNWQTTNITGTGVNSDTDTVTFSYANNELLVAVGSGAAEPIKADFGFDDMFGANQQAMTSEWTDEWNNVIWAVVEEDVNGNWTRTETAHAIENGAKGAATGESRVSYNSYDNTNKINTMTTTEVNTVMGFNFTRVEAYNENTGTSTETITGKFDQIGWHFLGQTYDGINATVVRDANWNITSITGTVQDPDVLITTPTPLQVTFSNNEIMIGGKSVSEMEDAQPHFKEGVNTWTREDFDGTVWEVVDAEVGGVWTSTETATAGPQKDAVRVHTSTWDNNTGQSTMTESFTSADGQLDFTRTELWKEDGTSTETITGKTNQLGWMWLDQVYKDVNVTIEQNWSGMTLSGAGTKQDANNTVVAFTLGSNEELLIDGQQVTISNDFKEAMGMDDNHNQNWESSWEWTDFDNTVWVVTDSQEGETWTSTETQYTDSNKTTATGAERSHSSTWNERTQTSIWTDSEKSADGRTDFTRVETQRADGTSTENLSGNTDKLGIYMNLDITISRDDEWNVTDISGTADGDAVTYNSTTSEITIGSGTPFSFGASHGAGGHANNENSENEWTWSDWDGVTWTVTDKQEGDTWTSTERGDNGDVRVHKNTMSGTTETWTDSYEKADGSINVTRVEVRNPNDNTSTTTITGKDNHFGWWDFEQPYTNLDVTISRDANWNITAVSGTADGGVTFAFVNGGLTINDVEFQSGGGDRSNLMQEASVNTWEWQDGNGVTWTVTDKQDGDTWTSTEEGSNGDVRINSSSWDSDINDYVNTTSFNSGTDNRDYSIRETWNADGSSTEVVKGATDQINWIYLGEIYTNVDVTIVRNQNWETLSITGNGTDSSGVTAAFGWDLDNYQMSFNSVAIADTNFGGGGQAQESWESTWEWTDWDGTLWTVTESQVGDVWTSSEQGSNGSLRVFKSSWDSVKQVSIWSESFDQDSSSKTDGGLDYTRVETYNPNGTSSETISGTTDNIAWFPLHGMYTNVSVTIERDASWEIYKVSGTGTDTNGTTASFGWSNNQITFGDNNVENPDDFKVNEDQYWENTSTWDDHDGTTWQVTEIQDGNTYTRTEVNAARGDTRTESNVWDHDTQTNTRTMQETNAGRGIDVEEISVWNSTTETETRTITGTTDHIDWMPLNGATTVAVTLSYDAQHNLTAASGTVTIDATAKALTFDNGQFLFDGAALTVQWTDEWDQTVWTMTQTQDGNTTTRTETATAGPRAGAEHVSTHSWNHETQIQTATEISKDKDGNTITDVTKVQTFTDGGGSTEKVTGSTNHLDWLQLGEIYTALDLTITRDGDWNIKNIEGTGIPAAGGPAITIGFSPTDNMLIIGGNLVAGDAIGQSFENSWDWQDGEGTTWTVVDKQEGDTWKSTETATDGPQKGAVRIMESTWNDTAKTNTWSETFTSADKTIDFTKTEVFNETLGTSTMTTTGKSDHIGWMYLGETYSEINVIETRGTDWNTTGITGTAKNVAGETVSISWDTVNNSITVDGDMLSTHGPGDFSMSADNFQNEWTYYDENGIEWTVVESEQDGTWVSQETNVYGDVRTNSNYWDDTAQTSKNVTKYKSADGGIDYKMTEEWGNDGSSILTLVGDTDHFGWDYVGGVYTDLNIVITRKPDWSIESLTDDGNAKNAEGVKVAISFDQSNPHDITIDGVSIYRMGDDFYKDFDQGMMGQMDAMQSGEWSYTYQNDQNLTVTVEEEAVVTDLITIKTDALNISLVFDLDEGGAGNAGISVLSSKGTENVAGFDYASLETWYTTVVVAADTQQVAEAAELAFMTTAVTDYLTTNSHATTNLAVTFEIADTFTTKESTALLKDEGGNLIKDEGGNNIGGGIRMITRTENLGAETEREETFQSEADFNDNNPSMWNERVRSFEDSEYGFKEISYETSSFGEDFVKTLNYAPDGTVTMTAEGIRAMGPGMLMKDIYITGVLEDGWKYEDMFGTGIIQTQDPKMAAFHGKTAVITSSGTDPYGGPLIHLTVDMEDGTFQEMDLFDDGADRQAHMHKEGNPLDNFIIEQGEGFYSSQKSLWEEVTFDNTTTSGTTSFTGKYARPNKPDQTISVTEVRTEDQSGMLTKIVQTVTSTRGGGDGESYTMTYGVNQRFDVEIETTGTKVFRGETYKDIDMFTEITPNGDKWVEGTGKKLDGTNVEFFKGHHDNSMEIMSINRDGSVHKITEDQQDSGGGGVPDQGPINELQMWEYTDHMEHKWTVVDKFDGQTRTSTETNTTTNDTRIIKETWSNDGSYSFEMTETTASTGAVFKESRSGSPTFADGKYKEVETVTITQTANDVTSTIESYTQTLVFNQDYSSTRTLEGEINIIGEVYTTTGNGVVITQDENWQASKVTGTATNSAGQAVTIDMNGTHPWGDPKMRVTNDDTGAVSNDERTVIGNKDATNLNDPVADNESVTIAENQAVIIDVLDGDTDADGDTLSIKSISDASYGQVNLANGTLVYTPNYGYSSDVEVSAGSFVSGTEYTITSAGTTDYTAIGATANTVDTVFTATGAGSGSGKATKIVPDTFTYTVTDGKGGTDQGNVAITVTGVNTPAVAIDDSFTFLQGAGSVVLDVLANDTDANGDDLSILNIVPNIPTATPNGGMFSLFGGVISYALPSATFSGTETVTYYVTDGSKDNNIPVYDTGVATVTIEAINKTPVAVADTLTLQEDVDSVQIDVLKNDTDADGDTLTIDSFTNPSDGSARIMGGALFYTPDENFSGTDSLTYTVTDPSGASATQTVTLTITGTNDAPVTVTDVLNVEEGSATGITIDLLSNDYDRESDAFTLTSVSTASHGTVVKNNNGTVTYTPGKKDDGTTNYTGADEFTYVTTDANGAKATGNVAVTVSVINNDPVAVTDASTVAEDSSSNRISVLTNDTDPEDNTLSLDTLSTPSHGTVTAAGNVVLYTPTANYSGSDSFNYWVSDGADGSAKGTVNITITSSNDAPTAVNDTLGTISGSRPTTVNLLLNDIDVDGDNLTISAVEGNIDISAGSFVTGTAYTIASVGTTDYTAIGASANTVDTVFTATGAGSGTGTATWDGDATHGNVTISGSSVRFNAARDKFGETDSFSYTITDPDGETSTAIANFTIADNTNPNSINDKATYLEDADAAQIDVTANDTDSDGDSVTVLQINTEPEYGTASVSNGKVFYVPDANYNGADSFTYIAKDGKGGRDEATVAITVTAVNDAPTTVSDTVSVETGSSANVISVLDNDSDADGQTISIASITDALHGTATLTEGILTYTPEATYTGPDSFSYKASDGTAETTGTVNITVSAGNNLPKAANDAPAAIAEDSKNNIVDVLANDTDADSDTLSVASVTQGENGTVKLTSGTVFYTPDANFAGTDIFTYTAADGNGGISSGRVTMTVTGSPDDPTATNDTLADVEAGSGKIEVDLISNDIDVDGETISITAVSDALYGTTTYTAGKIYYQPSSTVATDAFTYTLTDAGGETATGSVKVDVVTANSTPTGAVTITGGTQPYQTLTVSNTMADADGIADITVSAGSFVSGTEYTITSAGTTDYTAIGATANTVDTVFTATGAGSGTGTGTANGTEYFSYQWYADGTAISGETATTYTVSLEDVGNKYSVKASYTDDRGNAESKTSDATDAVTALDQPFSFVASEIASDGTLTLTLKADVEAIYSRSDISVLTGADLSLNIDWTKFDLLEGGTTKYSIAKLDSTIVAMDSSSTSATDSFDTLTLASLRLSPPLLTIVDTDTTTTGVGTTGNLLTVTLKPSDATEKVAVSLSGTIEANQGQVTFNQYDATTSNITGVTTNSEPGGSVTISGTVAVDEILTASHSLTDADGMRVVSYQWLRDGVAITNATDSTYTITTTDVNKALSVKASYTDGAGTAETKTSSSSTVTQTTANKPFMISSELITAEAASIALYGADYSLDADETIIKLTLNGDITRFDTTNALLYTSVAGAELDFSLDWTQFEDFKYIGDNTSTFEINKDYTGSLFLGSVTNDDGEFSKIVFSSLNTSAKPVLTLVDNVTSTAIGETDRPTTVDIATIYLNPIDSADDVEITYGGIVSANQGDKSFTQLSHSLEVEASTYDAIISTAATSTTITKLTGTSVNLWKEGTATSTSVAVDGGEISIDNTVAFDAVKLSATDAYDFDINISDAIDVLRHIVDLEALTAGSTAYHAADVDNDGDIDISDAIDVLRHIVDLETIDTFDVIDSNGARVTQLDANATGDAPTWTLVANGDVDMSGSYDDDYVVTVDIA